MSEHEVTEDLLEELASLPTLAHPTASPDGTEIAFYYDTTGRNELHVIDVESGETTQWSDGEVPRNARWPVDWAADGDRAFSTSTTPETNRTTSTPSRATAKPSRLSRWTDR
jgi:hypothetical protein